MNKKTQHHRVLSLSRLGATDRTAQSNIMQICCKPAALLNSENKMYYLLQKNVTLCDSSSLKLKAEAYLSLTISCSLKYFLAENSYKNDSTLVLLLFFVWVFCFSFGFVWVFGFFDTYHQKKIISLSRYARITFPIFVATSTNSVNGYFQQHAFSIKSRITQ